MGKDEVIGLEERQITELKERERRGRDKGADTYIRNYFERRGRYSNRAETYLISRYLEIKPSDTLLDIGCGVGRVAMELAKQAKAIVGIDISKKAIELFNSNLKTKNLECKGYVRDICEVEGELGPFDKAYSIATIQHIPSQNERLRALRKINSLLKLNGYLILTVLNWEGRGKKKLKNKEGFYGSGRASDLWRAAFTENDLRQLLEQTGFKALHTGGSSNVPIRMRKKMPEWVYFVDYCFSKLRLSVKIGEHLVVKAMKITEVI